MLYNNVVYRELMNDAKNSAISKYLKKAINRYQFDVVGWTEYCIDNNGIKKNELPVYRQKTLENLCIQYNILTVLNTPPIKKVYDTPNHYIQWLDQEYMRDKAFYEAILKNPSKFTLDNKEMLLDKEIEHSAKEYLKIMEKKKSDEKELIRGIQRTDWNDIRISEYPKVYLGLVLGASKGAIINNFGIYFINLLKAHFAGSRTAFLSSTGPTSWIELEQCKDELEYFKKQVVNPYIKKIITF